MTRSRGLVLVLLLATLAATGAFLANLALADLATRRDDPVGRLSPYLPGATALSGAAATAGAITEPAPTTTSVDEGEDHGGQGRQPDEDD